MYPYAPPHMLPDAEDPDGTRVYRAYQYQRGRGLCPAGITVLVTPDGRYLAYTGRELADALRWREFHSDLFPTVDEALADYLSRRPHLNPHFFEFVPESVRLWETTFPRGERPLPPRLQPPTAAETERQAAAVAWRD